MVRAVIFDLDDTLIVEEHAARAAFRATAEVAAARCDVDPARLALDARERARELWYAGDAHPYCSRIAISSWEGLWCRYEHDDEEMDALRAWAPTYRRDAWAAGLRDQGVEDPALATELGERFGEERRRLHQPFDEVDEVLAALRAADYRLALLTNGAPCLQREKVEGAGLAERFDALVLAGAHGTAKPDPAVFGVALELLGASHEETVMVGDSFERDVEGALAVGLGAVWINRGGDRLEPTGSSGRLVAAEAPSRGADASRGQAAGTAPPEGEAADGSAVAPEGEGTDAPAVAGPRHHEISTLSELPALLERL